MANTKILAVIFAATLLSGCQANKGYRDFMTKGANAFHEIKLEVTPDEKRSHYRKSANQSKTAESLKLCGFRHH